MDLKQLLERAIKLAQIAHQGQVDKAGSPYIGHPLRVMNSLSTLEEKIVGVLHDAIEDSSLDLKDLREQDFPTHIVEAINAITKRKEEDYETYLTRVMSNYIALRVKIADMQDNMDLSRIASPTVKDRQRLAKYQTTLPRLLTALSREKFL
ncbi:MAG: GTP pyrophosphokinase [Prochloraceae cyanobacterium]